MDNFKQGTKLNIRFITTVGLLTIEQLWTLKDSQLIDLEDSFKELVEKNKSKSSRRSSSKKTNEQLLNELRLAIITDILDTKESENETASKEKENKEHNQKIDALIAEKKEGALKDMSVEELEKLRK